MMSHLCSKAVFQRDFLLKGLLSPLTFRDISLMDMAVEEDAGVYSIGSAGEGEGRGNNQGGKETKTRSIVIMSI